MFDLLLLLVVVVVTLPILLINRFRSLTGGCRSDHRGHFLPTLFRRSIGVVPVNNERVTGRRRRCQTFATVRNSRVRLSRGRNLLLLQRFLLLSRGDFLVDFRLLSQTLLRETRKIFQRNEIDERTNQSAQNDRQDRHHVGDGRSEQHGVFHCAGTFEAAD